MGSEGNGMTLTVAPSTTHSSSVSGPILSFFRTWEGTETWPRFVTFVRITLSYKIRAYNTSSSYYHHVRTYQSVLRDQQHFPGSLSAFELPVSLGGILQGKGLIDAQFQFPVSDPFEEIAGAL